jgi:toxin ParE1/3/4
LKLEWSPLSIEDRLAIFTFVETENPRAAVRIDETSRDQVRRLVQFPQSGRPGRVGGTRELIVVGLAYIVAYRVTVDTVRILRVLHGAQQWPKQMGRQTPR